MGQFKWWREWRGGYWVCWSFGWMKVNKEEYYRVYQERMGNPAWSLENYEVS